MCNRKCSITRGKIIPTHRKRINKYCKINPQSCRMIKFSNPKIIFASIVDKFYKVLKQNLKNTEGYHRNEKRDTKETCYGDVAIPANQKPVSRSRDLSRPIRGQYYLVHPMQERPVVRGRRVRGNSRGIMMSAVRRGNCVYYFTASKIRFGRIQAR